MDVLSALPAYDFLPAPLWLVTALHLLTLTLHLLAMNLLFGTLLVLAGGQVEGKWTRPGVRRFLHLAPSLVAATVSLGVAPLLFVQLVYGGAVYAAAVVSAWWWFLIPFVVIVAYYALYGIAWSTSGRPRTRTWVVTALLGLLYVSVVYSAVFSLAERPAEQETLYRATATGLAFHADVHAWVLRWLHAASGAVMVGGFFLGLLAGEDAALRRLSRKAFVWGLIATMAVGMVYLLTLGDALRPFMRSSGISALTAGILLAFGALHLFLARRFVPAGVLLALSVGGMVGARHALRLVRLEGSFDPAAVRVEPQWGPFALFLLCFVVALGLIAIMLRLFFRSPAGDAPA